MKPPLLDINELVDMNADNEVSRHIRNSLASYIGLKSIPAENILFTNGADAAIHATVYATIKNRTVTYFDLNYRYATSLIIENAKEATERRTSRDLRSGTRNLPSRNPYDSSEIFYLTNPDNRLGLCFDSDTLHSMISSRTGEAIYIIDESYGDYTPDISLVAESLKKKNIIVIRTFSKFFSLSAQRIGYILSDTDTIRHLRKVLPQYPIATPSIISLMDTLIRMDSSAVKEKRARIEIQKNILYAICEEEGIEYARSNTDFVTIFDRNPETIDRISFPQKNVKEFFIDDKKCFRLRTENITFIGH